MTSDRRISPCRVYVNPGVPRGLVGFSPEFLDEAGIRHGHHIVVKKGGVQIKVQAHIDELLQTCEISMGPHLALFLGIKEADVIEIEDRTTIGDKLFDDVEDFVEVLEHSAERLKDRIKEAEAHAGRTVRDLLDHLVVHADKPAKSYLEVPPNPEGFGIPRGEVCEDPSLDVKEWRPDDGTGEVRIFKPGGDDEDPSLEVKEWKPDEGTDKVRIFRPEGDDEDPDA